MWCDEKERVDFFSSCFSFTKWNSTFFNSKWIAVRFASILDGKRRFFYVHMANMIGNGDRVGGEYRFRLNFVMLLSFANEIHDAF